MNAISTNLRMKNRSTRRGMKIRIERTETGGFLLHHTPTEETLGIGYICDIPGLARAFGWAGYSSAENNPRDEWYAALEYITACAICGKEVADPGYFDKNGVPK